METNWISSPNQDRLLTVLVENRAAALSKVRANNAITMRSFYQAEIVNSLFVKSTHFEKRPERNSIFSKNLLLFLRKLIAFASAFTKKRKVSTLFSFNLLYTFFIVKEVVVSNAHGISRGCRVSVYLLRVAFRTEVNERI